MVNDGTELRINRIRHSDLSDYTCVARNGEGRIHHTVKVVIAGDDVYSDDHDDGDDYGFWIYHAGKNVTAGEVNGDDVGAYLIFVIFFTQAKFLEIKIYTEKTHKLHSKLPIVRKLHSKLPIFALNL